MPVNVRFISDLHLQHKNMAIHRGFKDEFKCDEFIIDSWNSIVKSPKDLTYILGDIAMEKSSSYYILDRLVGRKVVILGNHEMKQHIRELLNYVENVAGMIDYYGFALTHCPIHPIELERYRGNIHGHTHEAIYEDKRYINVCAEVINYQPKTIEELIALYKL